MEMLREDSDTDLQALRMENTKLKREVKRQKKQLEMNMSAIQMMSEMNKRIHEEQIDTMEEAIRLSQAKSVFLSHISHEIRTPLNAIMGMTQIAQLTGQIEKKNFCLEKIEESSTLLLSIINDLLDMSKLDSDLLTLKPNVVSLQIMIKKVVNMLGLSADAKSLDLERDFDSALPEFICVDEKRLSQVFMNLLSNAVKFTPEHGTVGLSVKKVADTKDHKLILRCMVSDNGIGISKEAQKHLFQSFKQVDNSISRKFQGAGLGLVISKRIVELMGGTIWVESEEGKGSKFYFEIIVETADASQYVPKKESSKTWNVARILDSIEVEGTALASANANSQGSVVEGTASKENAASQGEMERASGFTTTAIPQEAGERDSAEKKCVLVVEDVEVNREILGIFLEDMGFHVVFAEDGQQAVDKFRENPKGYDFVFMDINMPILDGYSATKTIRRMEEIPQAKTVPIVALTANVFPEDVKQCLDSGMNDHVGKPIEFDKILCALKAYMH
ncbi:hypothetical protein FACS1894111_00700 [Clostridia bacterium]|nr:hypothetical protein FACS1894111_00700 [Clostridia bacterium]